MPRLPVRLAPSAPPPRRGGPILLFIGAFISVFAIATAALSVFAPA